MPHRLDASLESWPSSPVIRPILSNYRRKPTRDFKDAPAKLTPRQAVFYRNLIRIAEVIGSRELPIEFTLADETDVHLDYGCIKIAEHAGFIEKLADGASGVVETIRLRWRVEPVEVKR